MVANALRGSLVLSAARMAEQISIQTEACSSPVAVAASVELMHSYSLIHDDLPAMDDAELRRAQQPTILHLVRLRRFWREMLFKQKLLQFCLHLTCPNAHLSN